MAKIVFSDVDGTLVHSSDAGSGLVKVLQENRFIGNGTIGAIADLKADGVGFVLATGRRMSSYLRVRDVIPHDYALIEHGCVMLEEGKIDSVWAGVLQPVIGKIGDKKGVIWEYEQKLIGKGLKTDSEGRLATVRVYLDAITLEQRSALKSRIKSEAKSFGIAITMNDGMLDLLPEKGGKTNAIKHLSKSKGFSLEDVIVLCNDANDLGMLSIASYAACPADASGQVKLLVKRKGGYVSPWVGHEGAEDMLRNYVALVKS